MRLPAKKFAGHFHDTNNRAIENIEVSLDKGIRVFDSSIGGLRRLSIYAGGER